MHSHDPYTHVHDGHTHSHLPPGADGSKVTLRSLLALGVSGGLVPCPSALVLLLSSIPLGRLSLGIVLVVAFSFGLAAVLIAIGILLVRCKSRWLDRMGKPGSAWQRLLPLVSAAVVALLGVGIVVKGLMAYIA